MGKINYYLRCVLVLVSLYGIQNVYADKKGNKRPLIIENQQEAITGRVLDENNDPLIGATVKIQQSGLMVLTDREGYFSIKATIGDALTISYIGFINNQVKVIKVNVGDIILRSSSNELGDVVVVGYGTVRKSDLTGSVAKFDAKDIDELPITSIDQALQGKISGVQIVQSSGSPGAGLSFVVRGGNSLGSNQPLIILDGYPIEGDSGPLSLGADNDVAAQPGFNPLANLNPNDVESIEVLKDASSTAIYGSRGANGVVIITTKRGTKGRDIVNFDYRTDFSDVRKTLKVLNTQDFITYANEANLNDGLDSAYKSLAIDSLKNTNNNWQDAIFRNAMSSTYQLSFSGGDEKNNYYLVGSYADNEGVVEKSSFNKANIRLNYDRKISEIFKVKFNFTAAKSNASLGLNSSRMGLVSGNVISSALFFRPLNKSYNDEGEIDQEIADNPLTILNLRADDTEANLLTTNIGTDLKLTKDLTFITNVGVSSNSSLRQTYAPRGTHLGNQLGGYAFRGENARFNYLSEFTLNYQKSFKKSNINAVGGYTYQKWDQRSLGTSASGFLNDNLGYENFQSGNAPGVTSTQHREWALASFLARVNYSYDNKYLFTFTGRADGSTRLAKGHKWSYFPSAALAWKVHEEKFFNNVKFINTLKLRASYGLTGNQSVGVGATQLLYGTDLYVIGSAVANGYVQGSMANPLLKWETTHQLNLGADIGFLRDRLQLEVNLYDKTTDDLIINLPIPAATGYSNYFANSGSIKNQGLEIDASAKVLTRSLKWNVSGNISFNRNKMIDLGDLGDGGSIFGPSYLTAGGLLSQPIHVARLNKPVGSFYGYRIDGIYQNDAEVAAGPESTTTKPGDFKFVDIDKDGKITADDRTIIGNPAPDYTLGLTNDFSYKKLSLSFFIQGVVGNDIANLNRFRLDGLTGGKLNVSQTAFDNRWTGEGTSNTYPRPSSGGAFFNTRFSDFLIEDGSYVRLKNVTLSYSISKLNIKWMRQAKVFVTATNLLTIANYSGYDPEVNADYDVGLTQGVDNGTFPQVRTFTAGVNFKF